MYKRIFNIFKILSYVYSLRYTVRTRYEKYSRRVFGFNTRYEEYIMVIGYKKSLQIFLDVFHFSSH